MQTLVYLVAADGFVDLFLHITSLPLAKNSTNQRPRNEVLGPVFFGMLAEQTCLCTPDYFLKIPKFSALDHPGEKRAMLVLGLNDPGFNTGQVVSPIEFTSRLPLVFGAISLSGDSRKVPRPRKKRCVSAETSWFHCAARQSCWGILSPAHPNITTKHGVFVYNLFLKSFQGLFLRCADLHRNATAIYYAVLMLIAWSENLVFLA